MAFRVVLGDRVGDVLQDRRLAGLGRRHDQRALALADRHDQVDDPRGQPVRRGFQPQPLVGVQRRQLGEIGTLLGVLDRATVDAVQAHQRVELLPLVGLLALLGHPNRTGHRVTAAQAVLAHHIHRDVDVVRTGQVAGGAHEGVVVEDVEDAGYRLDDVVLTQFGRRRPRRVRTAHRGACGRGTGGRAGPDGRRRRRLAGSDSDSAVAMLLATRALSGRRLWSASLLSDPRSSRLLVLLAAADGCRSSRRCVSSSDRDGRSRFAGCAASFPALALIFGPPELAESLCSPLGGRCFGAWRGGRIRWTSLCSRSGAAGGRRAVGLSPGFLDRGDQFVLAHARRPLDAGSIGQRAQFGQHHGGQRARPTLFEREAVVWASGLSVVTAFDRCIAVGAFASRDD